MRADILLVLVAACTPIASVDSGSNNDSDVSARLERGDLYGELLVICAQCHAHH